MNMSEEGFGFSGSEVFFWFAQNWRVQMATVNPPATKKVTKPRKPKVDPGAADREEWAALRPDMDHKQAQPYDMNVRFKSKSVLKHPKFGLGVVKRLTGPHKIEVLFEEGLKLLRCG
jgi:hypothetical protein